ncbi:hypothetical protein EWF20_06105 [Sulfolobus sp. S-194]|uniref:hypothetical protein n=1 Tax=Sulfolobus sp. S-194 TaxID=2512240 RepID=UPI001436D268|nr:hypothetical protein [Sulfolobus sp. S-194]QIW23771.1 hypothetical protein EWF20_06105 [Sulfolobus sp. S-194]
MITTVVQKEETEIDIKKAIKASLLMTFFLVAVPINSIMLTQAIITYVYPQASDCFIGASIGYFVNNIIPILSGWAGVLAANSASMSNPLTMGVYLGLVETA